MAIPRIPKLHHFLNGVCKLKYITTREQGIILRVSCGGDWDLLSTFLIYMTSTSLHCSRPSPRGKLWLTSSPCHLTSCLPPSPFSVPCPYDLNLIPSEQSRQWVWKVSKGKLTQHSMCHSSHFSRLFVNPQSFSVIEKNCHSHGLRCTPSRISLIASGRRVLHQITLQTLVKGYTHRAIRTGVGQTNRNLPQIR